MQPWRRWREPLAVVLLVALAVPLVLGAVALLVEVFGGQGRGLGSLVPSDNLVLAAAAAAVLWCATPLPGRDREQRGDDDSVARPATQTSSMSPHAWPIAVTGLIVIGLTVIGTLALSALRVLLIPSWPSFPDAGYLSLVSQTLVPLAVPLVSLAAVILAVRRAAAARAPDARRALDAPPSAEVAHDDGDDVPPEPAAPERLPAAWQADEATGAVWLTADDAARGQPGLSWSEPAGSEAALTQGWGSSSDPSPSGANPSSGAGQPYVEAPYAGQPDRSTGAEVPAPEATQRPLPSSSDVDDDLR